MQKKIAISTILLIFLVSCARPAPILTSNPTPTTQPTLTSTSTQTPSPTETLELIPTGTEQVKAEVGVNIDRPINEVETATKTVENVVVAGGAIIPNVSLKVDSSAQLIKRFPMTDIAVANLALRAAAENYWYHGPVKHDPRTEKMPDTYLDEYAKMLADVQAGGEVSAIQTTTFAFDANKPGLEMEPMNLAFFCGDVVKVPAGVICINNFEIEYYKASSITNPDGATMNDRINVSQEFPRMNQVHEAGIAYEAEIDWETGTYTLKVGLAFNFGVGKPDKDLAGHTEQGFDWAARNQGKDQIGVPVSLGKKLLEEGFHAVVGN